MRLKIQKDFAQYDSMMLLLITCNRTTFCDAAIELTEYNPRSTASDMKMKQID